MTYTFAPVTACDMCGATSFRLLGMRMNRSQGRQPRQADGIAVSIKQCRSCDLIFADPQPIPPRLSDHYDLPPEDYWDATVFHPGEDYFADEIRTAKRLIDFEPGMTALDIGAGLGNAMCALNQAGFDTWGLEPSAPFRNETIKRVDPSRVLMTTVEEADFAPASFDFITFGAVLEHLYSPSLALDRALGWLKPGGILHVEVPNARHFVSKIINTYFRLRGTTYVTHLSPMHPPFHLYEFTLRSFGRYKVAEHRLRVCEIMNMPRPLHPPLRWWMEHTGTGMQLTVYLRR